MFARGTKLSRYRIEELLGRGGMGEVYRAHDELLDRTVALKIVPPEYASDRDRMRRFALEAKTASSLNHPHIVHVYDVGESDGVAFIAMEFVEGTTLARARLPLAVALSYLQQVAEATSRAHENNIVHRDLKPDNILISRDGYAKVADFGLAKLVVKGEGVLGSSEPETAVGQIVGTPAYMAPEQLLGGEIDHRTDIFAFGCILYEIVAGTRPFQAASTFEMMKKAAYDPPPALPSSCPPELATIIERCLQKSPSLRYPSLREVSAALRPVIQRLEEELALPTVARERGPLPRALAARGWAALAMGGLVVALVALVVGRYATGRLNKSTAAEQSAQTHPPTAHDNYLRGKVLVSSINDESNERAIDFLRAAVRQDPNLAEAHAELGRAFAQKSFALSEPSERARHYEEAEVEVAKALSLNPNLAQGHMARGFLLWSPLSGFPHEEAAQAYKRAVDLDPRLDEAHHQLGQIYLHVGLFEKGLESVNRAIAENPSNLLARYRRGTTALFQGDCETALTFFRTAPVSRHPSVITQSTASALICLNRDEEAMQIVSDYLRTNPRDEGGLGAGLMAILHARAGQSAEAEKAIRRAENGSGFGHFHHTAFHIACAYAAMGRPAEAVSWLRAAAEDGFPCYPLFLREPMLDGIRRDPRFVALMDELRRDFERRRRTM